MLPANPKWFKNAMHNREVDIWIFCIFNFLQFAIDGENNSKTKVEKVFFFIFMSSYAEMSSLKPKITK
jgi:hypothetical protein